MPKTRTAYTSLDNSDTDTNSTNSSNESSIVVSPANETEQEKKEKIIPLLFAALCEFETASKNGDHSKATKRLQILLGVLGTLAGMFYWEPSKICAQEVDCGNWALGNFFGSLDYDGIRYLHLISGGSGFAGTNAYFSYLAIPDLLKYIKEAKTPTEKAKRMSYVTAGTLSQVAQIALACMATGASPYSIATIFTTLGMFPGAIFGTVGLLEGAELPFYFSTIKRPFTRKDEKTQHFLREYHLFKKRIDAKLRTLIENPPQEITSNQPPFEFLLSVKEKENIQRGVVGTGFNYMGKGLGLFLVGSFAIPIVMGTYEQANKLLNGKMSNEGIEETTAVILTALVNLSFVYTCLNYAPNFVNTTFKLITDAACGRYEAPSMRARLFPKVTATTYGIIGLFQFYSYAAIYTLTKMLPKPINIAGMAGIVAYHLDGIAKLIVDLITSKSANDREKYLLTVQKIANKINWMSDKDFVTTVLKMTPAQLKQMGIRPVVTIEKEKPLENENTALVVEEDSSDEPKPRQSWCNFFSSCFRRAPKQNQEVDLTAATTPGIISGI